MADKSSDTKPDNALTTGFIQRVLFVIAAFAFAFLAFKLLSLWLLIFGAILVATVLRALAEPLIQHARFPPALAVLTVFAVVIGIIGTAFYLFGRDLVEQAHTLSAQIPAAWAALQAKLQTTAIGRAVRDHIAALGQQTSGALSTLPLIAQNVLSSMAEIFVAIIAGITLAINPAKYRDGVVVLFPATHHERLRDGMNAAGRALRLWFLGQFLSMIIVGTLVGVGLSFVGLSSALALGLLAGIAQFVPMVGATISACIGLLLAGSHGLEPFLWTLAVYTGVSQTEANLITPVIQRRIAEVPVVLTLFAVVGFAGLLGPIGVLYAMPLTVIIYTLVRRIYIENGQIQPPAERRSRTLAFVKNIWQKQK